VNHLLVAATLALVGAVPSLGQEAEQADALAAEIAETAEVPRPAKPEPRLSLFALIAYGERSREWDHRPYLGGGVSVRLGPSRSRFRGLGTIALSIPYKPASYTVTADPANGYRVYYDDASGRLQEAKSVTLAYGHYNRVRGALDGMCILNRDATLRVHLGAGVAITRSFVGGTLRAIWPDGTIHFRSFSGAFYVASFSGAFHVAPELLCGIEMGHGRLKPFVRASAQRHEGTLGGGVRF
jgi:hypothetical protein